MRRRVHRVHIRRNDSFSEDCIMRGGREPLRPWAMERVEEKGKKNQVITIIECSVGVHPKKFIPFS